MNTKEMVKAFTEGKQNEVFGIQETVGDDGVVKKFHIDAQALPEIRQTCPRKIFRDMLGSDWESQVYSHFTRFPNTFHAVQESGGLVTASALSPINAATALTAGLIGAQAKSEFQLAEFQYEKFVTEQSTSVFGGHKFTLASVTVDDQLNKPLVEGEQAPALGASPFWLWSQRQEVRQAGIQFTLEALLSDVNGAVTAATNPAAGAGYELKRQINKRALELLFGRKNTYCVNNLESNTPNANTYRSTNGAGILDYVNCASAELTTAESLNTAYNILAANHHPINPNWRMGFDKTMTVWVHPVRLMQTMQIIRSLQAWRTDGSTALGSAAVVNVSGNQLQLAGYQIEVEDYGYYGVDVLAAAGTEYDGSAIAAIGTSDQDDIFVFQTSKQAIIHESMQALVTRTLPLTGDDMLKRVVYRGDALLVDQLVMAEPRNLYKGGE